MSGSPPSSSLSLVSALVTIVIHVFLSLDGGQLQVETFATVNVSESSFNYFSNEGNSTVWPGKMHCIIVLQKIFINFL